MKKARATNTGGALQNETVTVVYPVPNVKINLTQTIQRQSITHETALYRNARGIVVWAGDDR
jgi:hypothetical protein